MKGPIKLHPKHGLNPTVLVCFWCNADVGVALLGASCKDEAPRQMVGDYHPCKKCVKDRSKGIVAIEVRSKTNRDTQPEITEGLIPTGRWCVLSEDGVRHLLKDPTTALKERGMYLDQQVFALLVPKKEDV